MGLMVKKILTTALLLLCFFTTNLFAQGVQQLWGMTYNGGAENLGSIISASADGSNQQLRSSFKYVSQGKNPRSTDMVYYNGKMYGMTSAGGSSDNGVIFEWDPGTNIYTKKYEFFSNGINPWGSLVLYNNKMYGMTQAGGANNAGVIFEWDPATNIYTKKIDLSTANGSSPQGNSLVVYNNKIYGMTLSGGVNNLGVLFEWDPATNIYTKKIDMSAANGSVPWGSLVVYNNKMYGMTNTGGANNRGVIFEWNPATNIYTKKIDLSSVIGQSPIYTNLVIYNNKMYGMTSGGGANGGGVIFEWDPATNIYTKKIELLGNGVNGYLPQASLVVYNNKMYGMTSYGGVSDGGVIFEWDPATNIYTKKIDLGGLFDVLGRGPVSSLVVYNNKMYGMTTAGGTIGNGVIFEWDPATNIYTKKIDLNITGGTRPFGSPVLYNNKLYGMTGMGGAYDMGIIFEFDPATNVYTNKFDFNYTIAYSPNGSLIVYNNKMYGMTYSGGGGIGAIFEWDPTTNIYTTKINFNGTIGYHPFGSLVLYNNKMYGYTYQGGTNDKGTIFEWDPATNVYTKKIDLASANGSNPYFGSMVVYNNKMYGMTNTGGVNGLGVIFEWNPATNIYTKKIDMSAVNGSTPYGSLALYNNKLYGMTSAGGTNSVGVIFEWDPVTNIYTKKNDLSTANGSGPRGSLLINNNKLYGMTNGGGGNGVGAIFEWDPASNIYTKKSDLTTANGNSPYGDLILVNAPVAKGSPPVCEVLPTITIDNTNNNIWVPIVDSKGDIAAEIKANNNNLGIVNTSLFTKTGNCREDASFRLYLNRNITITPQTQPSSNVDVRLYIRKSELDTIKVAMNSQSQPSGVASINEITVFKNNDACLTVGGNTALPLASTNGVYGVDYYLQVSTGSFSSFFFANKLLTAILPVKLFSFSGTHQPNANLLQWKATCYANTVFTLQRSSNGTDFANVGIVNGTAVDVNRGFEFRDNTAGENKWYYRLLITETGQPEKFSQTIMLNGKNENDLFVEILPNLVNNGTATINISSTYPGKTHLILMDMQGRFLSEQYLTTQPGLNKTTMSIGNYSNGMYRLVVQLEGGRRAVCKFIKQN